MSQPDFFEIFENLKNRNQPFVFYSLPGSKQVHCYYQEDNQLHTTQDLKTKGFVMSRFDVPLPAVYIPNEHHLEFSRPEEIKGKATPPATDQLGDKKPFINLVNRTKEAIENGSLNKLVVARKIHKKFAVDPLKLFENLLYLYPNALVYYWHHPKAENWIGASPEQLFSYKSGRFTTMALAGTLPYNTKENYHWGKKEKQEQAWVRDTLKTGLNEIFSPSSVKCSETFTHRAGNLVHLCNALTVKTQEIDLVDLVKKLHPTPAVGGIPLKEGLSFLSKNENLDRAYYAGFLGPIGGVDDVDFYVNLRCGSISEAGLFLYTGAGITQDSDAEKEWEETNFKANTLLAAL